MRWRRRSPRWAPIQGRAAVTTRRVETPMLIQNPAEPPAPTIHQAYEDDSQNTGELPILGRDWLAQNATVRRGALVSPDGAYRYWLSRQWARGPWATFVMLNPSTADACEDDPTIRRCIGFAKAWGLGGLLVVNLYAFRSTDPRGLWQVDDPVGPDNDHHLRAAALDAKWHGSPIVAAWGANARPDRVAAVRAIDGMDRLSHLGRTAAGAPRHPLYLRGDILPAPLDAAS